MKDGRLAKEIIKTLKDGKFYAECPCCEDQTVLLRDCELFYLDEFSKDGQEIYDQYKLDLKKRRAELIDVPKELSRASQLQARATNLGKILERLAPSLNTFGFECSDCRSLFDPIDYVVFEGLCRSGVVSRIIFADIKTGNASLSRRQREIRNLVNKRKVEFDVYEAKA